MLDDYQPRPRALWITALVFCAVVIADSSFRWATFQYRTFDLAFYVQSFWLMLHGQSNATILDVSLMGNHAEPICFLLLPLFWVWQSPMFFVVIQTLLVATMPFTAYRIARRMEFERRGALWLALSTLIAPAVGFMALHEFHPETLAAPLILLMLEARFAKRAVSFWLYFLLSAACKENVALVLGWMCVVHYFLERRRGREWQMVFNVVPGLIALSWVAVYALWVSPALNSGKVDYNELYGHVGGLSGIVRSPGGAMSAVLNAIRQGNLVWCLFVPFLLLPLLRPRWVIICAPIFAQHLLSFRPSEWSIHFHYAAPLLPLLWFGAAEACARLYWREMVAGWVLAVCAAFQIWMGPIRSVMGTMGNFSAARESAEIRAELLAAIPEKASVVAGQPYLSHLAMREKVFSLHHILKGLKTLSRADYAPPPVTDVVFVDAADRITFDSFSGRHHPAMKTTDGRVIPDSEQLLDTFLAKATWRSLSINEATILLREVNPRDEQPATGGGTAWDDHHRLVSVNTVPPVKKDAALILATYELAPNRQMAPWLRLYLQAADGSMYSITKGPIALGKPVERYVTDDWALRPPSSIPSGRYKALLLFYDAHERFFTEKARFEKRAFDLGEISIP